MNNVVFKENLKNKKYYTCILDLRQEIVNILVYKIQRQDEYFYFTTTYDLFYKSQEVLSENETQVAYKLYLYDIMDEREEFVLENMMEMYEDLKEIA